jgi:hypothetical protein
MKHSTRSRRRPAVSTGRMRRAYRVRRAPSALCAPVAALLLIAGCASPRAVDGTDTGAATSTAATGTAGTATTPAGAQVPVRTDTTRSTGVTIELDRASYEAGATVSLRITNGSGASLGYNACTREVERRDGAQWAVVPEPERVCTRELRLLGAGETVTERTDLPRPLPAGEYRLAIAFSREEQPAPRPDTSADGPIRATSTPFTVR